MILLHTESRNEHFSVNEERFSDPLHLLISLYHATQVSQKFTSMKMYREAIGTECHSIENFLQHNKLLMYFPKTNYNGCVLYQDSDTNNLTDSPDERKTVLGPFVKYMSFPHIENEQLTRLPFLSKRMDFGSTCFNAEPYIITRNQNGLATAQNELAFNGPTFQQPSKALHVNKYSVTSKLHRIPWFV